MEHRLKISVSRKPESDGIITYKSVSIRERLLRLILGNKHKVTVLIPGDSVGEIAISETKEGKDGNGKIENYS